jgi:uncharacterized membrane protein
MASPASIKKHPIHPILVAIPIGLWTFALVCDIAQAVQVDGPWPTLAVYSIAGGIVGAVLAAVPGLIDYWSIAEPEMKRIATTHFLVNVGGLVVFGLNLWSRLHLTSQGRLPLVLSIMGICLVGIGGWYGGEMVYVKGMAVEVETPGAKKNTEERLRRASYFEQERTNK